MLWQLTSPWTMPSPLKQMIPWQQKPTPNVIVVKDGNQDQEKIKALAEACNSDEVRDYITENYQGSVVAVF